MRLNTRIMRPFWYAEYTGKTADTDAAGNKTGEYTETYSNPVKSRANISAGKSSLVLGEEGLVESYDRTIISEKTLQLSENTRIWIGVEPVSGQTTNPHNYVVTKKQDGVNYMKYGLTKVDVR